MGRTSEAGRSANCDGRILEYLVYTSRKYGIESYDFLNSIISAYKRGVFEHGSLTIECRERGEKYSFFRITCAGQLIAQTRINLNMLKGMIKRKKLPDAPEFAFKNEAFVKPYKKLRIIDLKPGMRRINIRAKVIKKSKVESILSRFNLYPIDISTAIISDGTDSIKLILWNEQAKTVSSGDTVEIENGYVRNYRGEKQLGITRNGKINIVNTNQKSEVPICF
jgi:hypothetical protein